MTPTPALAALLLALPAWAQNAPQPDPPAPLAGPKVDEKTAGPTLVQYGMTNRLRRLDRPPEEAALELLRLSDSEKAEVEHILADRAAAVDKIVAQNIPLLLQAQLAREANDQKALREHLRAIFDKFAAVRARGSLREEIAYVLSDEHARQFEDLVTEYGKALVRDEVKNADEARGERGRSILLREQLLTFGQEIRRSYERQVQARTARLEEFLKTIDATPEQAERLARIARDAFEASNGHPTLQQRRETIARVLRELTPDQRRAVLEDLYAPAPPAPAADDPK
jgi:autonomous glycyl radical cofactor GrcA